jgi:predicted  nucleic acid-binding Zn-ribbon protein
MKLLRILTENTVTPIDKKMVSVLQRMDVDPEDVGEIWTKLSDPLSINDMDLKIKIAFLYTQSCYYGEDGLVCNDIDDVDWDEMVSTDMFGDDQLALAEFLNVPPFLLGIADYSHYGLMVYEFDGDTYAVGDESDADDAMYQYSEQMIEYELDSMEEWWLNDYLSPNQYAIEQFCEEEADNRLDNMTEEEMMEEAGMDPDLKQEEIDEMEVRKEDKEVDLLNLQDELEELENLRDEAEEEYGDESDEFNEADEEHGEKEYEVDNLTDDIESLQEDIETAQQELSNMPEEAKDQLYEEYKEDYQDTIDSEGVEYFTSNLGMNREDAIDYYFDFDKEGAIEGLADDQDRGDTLAGYDGEEHDQEYDGVDYYIYQQG